MSGWNGHFQHRIVGIRLLKTSSTAATTVNKAAAYGGKNDTAAASSILPKTGDVAVALPLAAVALAAFAIILVALRRRKED